MSDGTLYEIAAQQRAALLRGERQVASELVRAYGDIWQRVRRQLVYLLNEQELAGGVIDFEWWLEYDRLGKLQAQVEAELRVFAAFADGRLTAQQAEAVDAALRDTEQLVRIATDSARTTVAWATLPTAALEDLIGFTATGSPLRALLDALGPAASAEVRDRLIQGLALGFNPARIADEVRAAFGGNLARALTVSRTEVLRAYREASRRSYEVNSDVIDGWIWNCACTERSCAMCWAMHGTVHGLDEVLDDHPNGRCSAVPHLRVGGQPVAIETGPAQFAKLTPEQQDAILGKAAGAAYRDGLFTLPDVVKQTFDPAWGPMKQVKSLRELLSMS